MYWGEEPGCVITTLADNPAVCEDTETSAATHTGLHDCLQL